ncbi:hypothetical protein [Magnetospirillum sulfuroxidans]|uniref:Uncharacterized protein n=1 Tax=Magnetospirillum sulfuroxidans TaxID=611300 RepID=A0ABS5IHQ2_9PROT|nr:hypothetical protein [Magnetospirillum sulfuroxidans]MBR9973233.1 hypothetical protein [Magnetospirillum sulfuroxidans]
MAMTIMRSTALEMALTTLRTSKEGLSKEKLEELTEKVKKDQEVLDKVQMARKQARKERKSNAGKKLEEIKKRIEMLKRFALTSEGAARELARLARELKQAAREFRQSGAASDITTSTSTPESVAAERQSEAKADKEFANEVRKIAQILKAMIRRNKPDKNSDEERGLEQARKDIKSATDDAGAIITEADGGGGGLGDVGGLLV